MGILIPWLAFFAGIGFLIWQGFRDKAEYERNRKPVAWRVKDYADGWILFNDEAKAKTEAEATGAVIEPLFKK